jgi:hypothetical protein
MTLRIRGGTPGTTGSHRPSDRRLGRLSRVLEFLHPSRCNANRLNISNSPLLHLEKDTVSMFWDGLRAAVDGFLG